MPSAILLSGGIDSSCLAWKLHPEYAITINYGQLSAEAEIEASSAICKQLGIEHIIINVDLSELGSGDLVGRSPDNCAPESDWWPYRNQMLITLAAMKLIRYGVNRIYIGSVKSDSYHTDGTKKFIEYMNVLMQYQEGSISIEAPSIEISATELVRYSGIPLDVLGWSHSCHKSNFPCGNCRGCNKHLEITSIFLPDNF